MFTCVCVIAVAGPSSVVEDAGAEYVESSWNLYVVEFAVVFAEFL